MQNSAKSFSASSALRVVLLWLLCGWAGVSQASIIIDNQAVHLGDEDGATWVPPTNSGPQYRLDGVFGSSTNSLWVLTATFVNLRHVEQGSNLASYDGHSCDNPPGCDVSRPQVRLMDGTTALYSGNIAGNGTRTLWINRVVGSASDFAFEVDAGSATAGKFAMDGLDDFTWDSLIIFILDGSLFATRFNAVEPGASITNGPIQTKISGTGYNLDVGALNFFGTGLGSTNDSIEIYLLDATDNGGANLWPTGCLTSWGTQVNALVASVDFSTSSNPALTTFAPYANALREARLQFVETTSGGGSITIRSIRSCSRDRFAIRPATFTVAASDTDEFTAGTVRPLTANTATGLPIHRAGSPFTLTVSPLSSAAAPITGYDGSPAVSVNSVLLPVGGNPGAVATPTWTTQATEVVSSDATWSEVGVLRASVQDVNFTAVDSSDGTPLAQRTIGPVTTDIGRFVPFDFTAVQNAADFMPGCGTFTYAGQPFNYNTAPILTLTAVNAGGGTTQNYTGTQMRLSATPQATYAAAAGVLDTTAIPVPDSTIADLTAGNVSVTLTAGLTGLSFQRTVPAVPFDAEIAVSVNVVDDDGVASSLNPISFGQPLATLGVNFVAAAKPIRFGQLTISNGFGSELTPLQLPVAVEFFDNLFGGGNPGFTVAADDGCTDGTAVNLGADIALDESQLGGGGPGQTVPTNFAIANGAGNLTLSAPNARGTVGATLDLTPSHPWLFPDTDGNGVFDNAPTGTATFGVFSGNDRKIYTREATP